MRLSLCCLALGLMLWAAACGSAEPVPASPTPAASPTASPEATIAQAPTVVTGAPVATPTSTPALPAPTRPPASTQPPAPPMTPPVPPSTAGTGRISGVATLSPGCPGPTVIGGCGDRAYTGAVIARTPGGVEVARTVTDKDGRFELTLAPGRYVVAMLGDNSGVVRGAQAEVQVVAGQTASVQLRGDSGLR